MSEIFNVRSSAGNYSVSIDDHKLVTRNLFLKNRNCCYVVDSKVKNLWGHLFADVSNSLIEVDAQEANKTLSQAAKIIELMRSKGITKDSVVIAVGGGIIQDLCTFVCSIYMRGVDWIYIPTTLLGMVDSCIGGKSSLNVGSYKNIAGNFYPPTEILVDANFCKTLSDDDLVAGLCEAIKICYADDGNSLEEIEQLVQWTLLNQDASSFSKIAYHSLTIKKKFIEKDEFDIGVRQHLNFGHGIGHAIEASTDFRVIHGVAVGLGMLAEVQISNDFGFVNGELDVRSQKLIFLLKKLLSRVTNLKAIIKEMSVDVALEKFKSDKKHTKESYTLIIINQAGYLQKVGIPKNELNDRLIKESLILLPDLL